MHEEIRKGLESGTLRKILLVNPGRLGDVLFTTPAIRAFKEAFPATHLTALTASAMKGIFEHNPHLDDLMLFDLRARSRWWESRKVVPQIRKAGFDLAVILLDRKVTLRAVGKAGVPNIWPPTKGLPTDPGDPHHIHRPMAVLAPLGITTPPGPMELHIPDDSRERADAFLKQEGIDPGKRIVVLHPGAHTVQMGHGEKASSSPTKWWDPEHYQALAEELHRALDAKIVLTGTGPFERDLVSKLAGAVSFPVGVFPEGSVLDFAALVDRANLFVSGDTGPMHIAAARKIPQIAIWGPTPLEWTHPFGEGEAIILNKDEHKTLCTTPDSGGCICMSRIPPEDVFAAAKHLLEGATGELPVPYAVRGRNPVS